MFVLGRRAGTDNVFVACVLPVDDEPTHSGSCEN